MKITKLLYVDGSKEINAALIKDVDEEYPVFLESLHNGVYFNELLNSGYVLTGLPYNFVLNGVSIYQLPTESFEPTDQQREDMYNYIGAPLSYDELRSHIDESVAVTRETPKTEYTINTRKELLDYLDLINEVSMDDDFKPLNYFVAPEARLTIKEYMADEYAKYVQIISNRRIMSLGKYRKLFAWLQMFGMSPQATPLEVLDAYFAWGIDGVDFPIISSHKEMREAELTASNMLTPVYRKTIGFVDSRGNMFTNPKESNVRWEPVSSNPTFIQELTATIPVGDSSVCDFQCRIQQPVTVLEGTQFNASYSNDRLIMLKRQYPTIQVISPVSTTNIPLELASPAKQNELFERSFIEALATMLYERRRNRAKVSSYQALTVCGTNPFTAMNYIAVQDEMDKGSEDEDKVQVDYTHIQDFLAGNPVGDEVADYLSGILEGRINIDNIGRAKEAEAHVTPSGSFAEIYALHYVMGIPLQEIYNKFSAIGEDDQVIVFTNGDYNHTVQVSQLKLRVNGYLSDIQNYDLKCARECTCFNYIINVAREVGINECDRHVGIEFYSVVVRPKVKEILDKIEAFYVDTVNAKIADAKKRDQLIALRHMFKLARFFEIALNGSCTLPDVLGGTKINVPYAESSKLMYHVARKIENIVTYCNYTVGGSTSRDMVIDMYCVNAYVTPERVIPRKGYTIHEAAFYALWNDYSSNPALQAQMVEAGVIPQGFIPWTSRYSTEMFAARDLFNVDENDSLIYYNQRAVKEQNEFPANIEFKCTTHPIEYMFPGLSGESEDEEITGKLLPAPREGGVIVRLGYTRELTLDMMKQYLYPEQLEEEPTQYLREFSGLAADAFVLCPDVLSKMPARVQRAITVSADNEHVYLPIEERVVDFRDIPMYAEEYGVVNIYDRIYMFIAANGQTWEVRV